MRMIPMIIQIQATTHILMTSGYNRCLKYSRWIMSDVLYEGRSQRDWFISRCQFGWCRNQVWYGGIQWRSGLCYLLIWIEAGSLEVESTQSYRTNSAQTVPQQVYATPLHFTIMQCKLYQYVYTRMSIHYLLRTGSRSSRGGMMEDGALTAE